jgi:hypothetical protein
MANTMDINLSLDSASARDVNIHYPIALDPEDPDRSFDLKLNELMERKRNLSRTMLMPTEFGKEDYETLISEVFVKRQ